MVETPAKTRPTAVLFACNLNAVRSPMAEALMKHYFGDRIFVDSVGVRAGYPDPFAMAVMAEIGLPIEDHEPKSFDELQDTSFDIVISLTPEAQHKAVELTRTEALEVEYWPTYDPTAVQGSRDQVIEAYRKVRDDLAEQIKARFGEKEG